jgi:hypothetical protein
VKSLELRAAVCFSWLWQRQGERAQARQLLAEEAFRGRVTVATLDEEA